MNYTYAQNSVDPVLLGLFLFFGVKNEDSHETTDDMLRQSEAD